jgi:hypothetical protein
MKPTEYLFLFSQYLAEINRLSEGTNDRFGYTYARGKSPQIYTCRRDDGRLWGKPVTYRNASEMLAGFESIILALRLTQYETF